MIERRARTTRQAAPAGRRPWLRPAAWFGLLALCFNLLVPLAVVAAATPADADGYICHAATAGQADQTGQQQGPASDSTAHHCPLCLVLAGGTAAPPGFAPVAALPSPPVLIQPHRTAPTLPPASVRLIVPESRAPPAV